MNTAMNLPVIDVVRFARHTVPPVARTIFDALKDAWKFAAPHVTVGLELLHKLISIVVPFVVGVIVHEWKQSVQATRDRQKVSVEMFVAPVEPEPEPELTEVEVEPGEPDPEPEVDEFEDMTIRELKDYCKTHLMETQGKQKLCKVKGYGKLKIDPLREAIREVVKNG